ncbi:MAG: exodeoxyribonuclease V subunit alpha [Desulfofustis sp.]|nr:exodeoxyribonuclease V subunit alpha [Desulfofustis sp.]
MIEFLATPQQDGQEAAPLARYMAAALLRHSGIDAEREPIFRKAVERLTTALAQGHTRIGLGAGEREIIRTSPLVGEEAQAPLVLSDEALYFGRYFRYEVELAQALLAMTKAPVASGGAGAGLSAPAGLDYDRHQRQAIAIAMTRGLCIISGGPGTGKTTLIVKIIQLLLEQYGPDLKIGLAAPTGKAAMRMNESIHAQRDRLELAESLADAFPGDAVTLHRLLGMARFSSEPRYHAGNPLEYDVIVVDEASMVDLAMMWRLAKAVKPGTRLILIGDRDQLASVESGAVLADCIDSLEDHVARLEMSYRFNRSIASLAEHIRNGDGGAVWSQLTGRESPDVRHAGRNWLDDVYGRCEQFLRDVGKVQGPADYPQLFRRFGEHMVLCALRKGRSGVSEINRRVELRLAERGLIPGDGSWYAGKPVMISANDHALSLFNGDIGLCLPDPAAGGQLRVWFEGGGRLRQYPPGRIAAFETAWAMTIHKAQGSEFGHVTLVLPDADNQVLCRELLYTGVTRARRSLTMVAGEDICVAGVSRRTNRHSGLAGRLNNQRAKG